MNAGEKLARVGNEEQEDKTDNEMEVFTDTAVQKVNEGEGGTPNIVEREAENIRGGTHKKKKKKKKKKTKPVGGEKLAKVGNEEQKDKTDTEMEVVSGIAVQKVNGEGEIPNMVERLAENIGGGTPKKKKKKRKKNKATPAVGEKRKVAELEVDKLDVETENETTDGLAQKSKKTKTSEANIANEKLNGHPENKDITLVESLANGNRSCDQNETVKNAEQTRKKKKKKKKSKVALLSGGSNEITCSVVDGKPFSSLKEMVSEETLNAIAGMGFSKMTPIQSKAIPPLLEGKDLRGTAKTGSGKTLAFIIPTVERLCSLKFKPSDGTGAIIISPTRELSLQTFSVLNKVIRGRSLTSGIIIGGVDQANEVNLLKKGINVLVATPGRLLSHLKNTSEFVIKNLACLVIDEADCILDVGFEEDMNKIIELLPKNKQTMFFSATKDNKVNLLARLSLNSKPMEVEDDSNAQVATVDSLEQAYVMCHAEKKFEILYNFLEKNKKKKIMVFFTTCNAVKFYHGLLNVLGFKVMHIHGKQQQQKRTSTFYEFCKSQSAILLCTDVGARGWDIPSVDWIVQYDPPEEPKEYIHRVGRTARAGGNGKALLIIREEEQGLLEFLKNRNVHLKSENITLNKMIDLQLRVEKNVKNNSGLKVLATVALMSYIRAYLDCKRKDIYSLKALDVKKVAKCLGFVVPPPLPKKLQSELEEILPKKIDSKSRKLQKANTFSKNVKNKSPFGGRGNYKTSFKMKNGPREKSFTREKLEGKDGYKLNGSSRNGLFKKKEFDKNLSFKGRQTFDKSKVFKAKNKLAMNKMGPVKDKKRWGKKSHKQNQNTSGKSEKKSEIS